MVDLLLSVLERDPTAVKVLPKYARLCLHHAGALFERDGEEGRKLEVLERMVGGEEGGGGEE